MNLLWYIDCEYQMGGWELLSIHGIEPVFINMFAFSIGFMPHCRLLGGQYYPTHHWISAVLYADMGWRGLLQTIYAKTLTFNSLAPGRFEWNFIQVILKLISVINGWGIFCEMIPRRMCLDLTYDKSTLVQVMAWCRQATSHYLNQCWPRSLPPYGVTRPQCVKQLVL